MKNALKGYKPRKTGLKNENIGAHAPRRSEFFYKRNFVLSILFLRTKIACSVVTNLLT